ncbi:hypothetical protein SS50377_26088 [Spironucleus salmonicida]|uniref:Uncharacterized protein n=1 Tax=Spironucleus salmonicida TaxID=348837 RepID=V6LE33_9EUKA|nr:hypothetical protein SS50377_26088 [Spironucleus salmonicida]|eukprot:EST42727.1 Hypothetical protein SS50377_ee041 [Spironucleus salmonicida]
MKILVINLKKLRYLVKVVPQIIKPCEVYAYTLQLPDSYNIVNSYFADRNYCNYNLVAITYLSNQFIVHYHIITILVKSACINYSSPFTLITANQLYSDISANSWHKINITSRRYFFQYYLQKLPKLSSFIISYQPHVREQLLVRLSQQYSPEIKYYYYM